MSPGWITGGNLTEDLGRQGPQLAGWPLSSGGAECSTLHLRMRGLPHAECEASNELI